MENVVREGQDAKQIKAKSNLLVPPYTHSLVAAVFGSKTGWLTASHRRFPRVGVHPFLDLAKLAAWHFHSC